MASPSLFRSCWPLGCTAPPPWQKSTKHLLHLCCLGLIHFPHSSFCKTHHLKLFMSPQISCLSFPPHFFSFFFFSFHRCRNILTVLLSPSSLPQIPHCSPVLSCTLIYLLFLFSLTSPFMDGCTPGSKCKTGENYTLIISHRLTSYTWEKGSQLAHI